MSKPASKTTRVAVVFLCLLGLGFGLFWCGYRHQENRHSARETARAQNEARLVMVNEGNCEWVISITPVGETSGKAWKIPVGKTAEIVLLAGRYEMEQKLVAEIGGPQARQLEFIAEGSRVYHWRLVNLLSSDAAELRMPLEGEAVP